MLQLRKETKLNNDEIRRGDGMLMIDKKSM